MRRGRSGGCRSRELSQIIDAIVCPSEAKAGSAKLAEADASGNFLTVRSFGLTSLTTDTSCRPPSGTMRDTSFVGSSLCISELRYCGATEQAMMSPLNIDATAMTRAGNGAVFIQSIIAQEVANFLARG